MKERFFRLLGDVNEQFPQVEVDLEVGEGSEFPNDRDYAYCEHNIDNTIKIVVAPGFEDLPEVNQEAILRHELAHALEFALGAKRAGYEFGPMLCRTSERRADQIAEVFWQEPILYDEKDLQTLDQGTYPRPERLGL